VSTDGVDHRGLLADEELAGAVQHQAALLLGLLGLTNRILALVTASQNSTHPLGTGAVHRIRTGPIKLRLQMSGAVLVFPLFFPCRKYYFMWVDETLPAVAW
jgi:hypothetical protein